MDKLVILTGAGMSAESGIKTFRDNDGLWENYRVEDVCSIEAWSHRPEVMIGFYNQRRKQLLDCNPNKGHRLLVELENNFDVQIITQNVDDLHERAGSSNILHLHGELRKVRSSKNPNLIYELEGWELKFGQKAEDGGILRPHIVWFGEAVPMMDEAIKIVQDADILVIIGTSLAVYPAAGLVGYAKDKCQIFMIDPKIPKSIKSQNINCIETGAGEGVKILRDILLK